MPRSVVSALSLVFAVTAFAVTPPLGNPVPVASPEYGESLTVKETVDIATNGDTYFAVWSDIRADRPEVYGTRITADGTVLDRAGLRLGSGAEPNVFWNGSAYVVIWEWSGGLWAATVTDGKVDTTYVADIGICPANLQVATNGTTSLATCGGRIYLLDRQFRVIKETPLSLVAAVSSENSMAVASLGTDYLIAVATPAGRIMTQRVDADGNLAPALTLSGSFSATDVDVASNGSEWLVVWAAADHIEAQRVTRNDTVTGEQQRVVQANLTISTVEARRLNTPSVAWRGSDYVLTYVRGTFESARFHVTPVTLTPAPIASDLVNQVGHAYRNDLPGIAVKADGSGAVIWLDPERRVRVGLFDAASIATPKRFTTIVAGSSAAHEQWHPAVVRVGMVPVTVWMDYAEGVSNIRLARPGATAVVVATLTALRPRESYDEGRVSWLDVMYDGDTIWVAWFGDAKKLNVRRYTSNLVAIDDAPRVFDAPAEADTLLSAAVGGGALTATFHRRVFLDTNGYLPQHVEVVAKVLRAHGAAIEAVAERTLISDTDHVRAAGAAWDGEKFFVAWRQQSVNMGDPPLPYPTRIRAVHITTAGEVVQTTPLALYYGEDFVSDLFVESSPHGIVLAWSEDEGVRVARYEPSHPLLRPTLLPMRYSGQRHFGGIAPLASGEVDLYWSTRDHRGIATILYERLSASLESTGDAYVTPPFEAKGPFVQLDAIAIGTMPVVVHTQIDRAPDVGGVTRVMMRQGAIRRRAVR
jgi:hypothetical protein